MLVEGLGLHDCRPRVHMSPWNRESHKAIPRSAGCWGLCGLCFMCSKHPLAQYCIPLRNWMWTHHALFATLDGTTTGHWPSRRSGSVRLRYLCLGITGNFCSWQKFCSRNWSRGQRLSVHFRDVVDLHVFDEQEQQTSAAIPFGIDTLGLWEEKPWKIDKFPIDGSDFDCDKDSTCLQPHVSDRWCANGWGTPLSAESIAAALERPICIRYCHSLSSPCQWPLVWWFGKRWPWCPGSTYFKPYSYEISTLGWT